MPPGSGRGETPSAAVEPEAEQSSPFAERAQRSFFPSLAQTWRLAAVNHRFFRQVRADCLGPVRRHLHTWELGALVFATPPPAPKEAHPAAPWAGVEALPSSRRCGVHAELLHRQAVVTRSRWPVST
jgi:hypothetical protein